MTKVWMITCLKLAGNVLMDEPDRLLTCLHCEVHPPKDLSEPDYVLAGAAKLFPSMKGDLVNGMRGRSKLTSELTSEMISGRYDGIIVHVHGFSAPPDMAAARAGQLSEVYGAVARQKLLPISLSWPATDWDGSVLTALQLGGDLWASYSEARGQVPGSTEPIHRALRHIIKIRNGTRPDLPIHLFVHSQGAQVLNQALGSLENGRLSSKGPALENVFLMAPDEEKRSVSKGGFAHLPEIARRAHLYFSRDDIVLGASQTFGGHSVSSRIRLGLAGLQGLKVEPAWLRSVDCSTIAKVAGDPLRHQYYRLSREVIEDVAAQLKSGPKKKARKRAERKILTTQWRLPTGENSAPG